MAAALAFGFSCGLPFMLVFQTLSAWLAQDGIKRATIGMLAWVGLMYSLKFLWAPIVDRLRLPLLFKLLGRRRSWIVVAQVGLVLALANMARQSPAASLAGVALGALLIAFFSATQDIAVDAWRIESAPPELQGAMSAAYQLGYRLAIATSTAGALWIAADYGWLASYGTMAALMGIGIAATLLAREPQSAVPRSTLAQEQRVIDWLAQRTHWPGWLRTIGATFVGAVVCPLTDFFARHGTAMALLLLGFVCTYRLTDYTMGVMTNPFYLQHGYTLKEIAAVVKVFGLISALLGVVIGGVVVARLGLMRALFLGSVLVMLSNLGFALLATTDTPTLIGLGCVNSFDNLALGVHGTSLLAFMASLTNARYTATQYALLSSVYPLVGKLLMGTSGFVVDAIDFPAFFVYTASLSLPALALLYFVARRFRPQAPHPGR